MKTTAFFCENCGKPVPLSARVCPHCQRRFDAVRCPRCDHVGKPDEFQDGCPSCGYLKGTIFNAGKATDGASARAKSSQRARTAGRQRQAARTRRELPGWAYSAAAIVLLIVLGILAYILVKMIAGRGA